MSGVGPTLQSSWGVSRYVGSVTPGKMADLVLWNPAFFGVKPDLIIKGGMIAASLMGSPNASIPTPEPVLYRPMFGAFGKAVAELAVAFVSAESVQNGNLPSRLGRRALPVSGTRTIGKSDMALNDALPDIQVDPERYVVTINGETVTSEAATEVPLAQRYFLF